MRRRYAANPPDNIGTKCFDQLIKFSDAASIAFGAFPEETGTGSPVRKCSHKVIMRGIVNGMRRRGAQALEVGNG
jgi:hypothetical protein